MSGATSEDIQSHLERDEVHVWYVMAHAVSSPRAVLSACLSASERERASRLHSRVDRDRFIAERAVLRHTLARYTGVAPTDLPLYREQRGKPALDERHGIYFSLSHARALTLIAVARTAVGVDIEHSRQPRHLERTARRILHADTVSLLLSLPDDARTDAFLRAWTQREAHVKAVGGGLFHTPDSLPFELELTAPALHTVRDRTDRSVWTVARFAPAPRATAAVVAHGDVRSLQFFTWNETLFAEES